MSHEHLHEPLHSEEESPLSPWWRNSVIIALIIGFTILIWLSVSTYSDAPPIPEKVVDNSGEVLFTGHDITAGQEIFLKYGLMQNGSIWSHGAYLGPDFSADYLHTLYLDMSATFSQEMYGKSSGLTQAEQDAVDAKIKHILKENRYNKDNQILVVDDGELLSYKNQIKKWETYFSKPEGNAGLSAKIISDPEELRQLTAFFAWTAWASVVNRPDKNYTYTNNFPYDPNVGNVPSSEAVLWSAISLITLLGSIAIVLFIIGRFDFLGWKGGENGSHVHPYMIPGISTQSQRMTIKYFLFVAVLFLLQVLVGAGLAHYRADPGSFFGIDISSIFPSNILRTWHVQLSILWVATAYVAGGLFLAPFFGISEKKFQKTGVNLLFGALTLVILGSLLGEYLGVNQWLGKLWFWFGNQGWEYLELGRFWQILLIVGMVFWVYLLYMSLKPAMKDPKQSEIASMFMYSAIAIPIFYLPALFYGSETHFTIVDTWRFWIVHLWVEGFFELFVTVIVASIFFKLGLVTSKTAARVIYLDAILYLGSGIVGTGHHWYWTGQSHITMALAAVFSAMEVVPLTLLTLDAWDFIQLSKNKCDVCGNKVSIPHKWTFYFLISVGVWNFVGAGVFGFLINLPIVSYYEAGTLLTPNHGHAAMMGVFGMLAVALMVFVFRQVLSDEDWNKIEKYVRYSFAGLNIGLLLMVILSLFPGGIMQLMDVLNNGYWHARSRDFLSTDTMIMLEWFRMPGDTIFLVVGVLPLVWAAWKAYISIRRSKEK